MKRKMDANKKTFWQNMKLKMQQKFVYLLRDCSSRYIVWRLDHGKPITGSGLRFIERRLYSMAKRCCEPEPSLEQVRICALEH